VILKDLANSFKVMHGCSILIVLEDDINLKDFLLLHFY
jgi:hypothetical protein